MSLYHITAELAALIDLAESGVPDAEMAAAVAEHRTALVEALDAKADSYAALIQTLRVRAEARRDEADRIKALAAADDGLADRLADALREAMQQVGRTKIDTTRFRLSVRTNGGKLPLVIEDEAALPPVYRVPVYTERVDRDGLRAALEAGEAVHGARLGERGVRLDIR